MRTTGNKLWMKRKKFCSLVVLYMGQHVLCSPKQRDKRGSSICQKWCSSFVLGHVTIGSVNDTIHWMTLKREWSLVTRTSVNMMSVVMFSILPVMLVLILRYNFTRLWFLTSVVMFKPGDDHYDSCWSWVLSWQIDIFCSFQRGTSCVVWVYRVCFIVRSCFSLPSLPPWRVSRVTIYVYLSYTSFYISTRTKQFCTQCRSGGFKK